MKKILALTIITLLFLTSCLPSLQGAVSTSTPVPPTATTSPTDLSIYKDGINPVYQNILNELPNATLYNIEFVIADDLYHITGSETVTYTNAENIPLNEVKFRLFPNILGGEMKVTDVTVNGEVITPDYALNNSLITLPFKVSLQPKEKAVISMKFEVTVPQTVELNYGVQAYFDNILTLAHAYPVVTVYDDEGWNAEIPPQSGDVTYADMSFFIVTVDAPKEVVVVGSGREIDRQDNGSRQTVKYEAGPVRDFYVAASPEFEIFTRESNGVTLRFYSRDHLQAGAEFALDAAARSIEVFTERYAPYPYTELDFVSTPTLALGIEYPGMIAITEWIMEPGNQYLEGTVVHEVGHQWFYNLVGNDQLDDPWLDESLTQFATLQYFTDEYGQDGAQGYRNSIEGRWQRIDNANIPVGLPVREYSDAEYSGIVYGRGALFFEALRAQLGNETFDIFIKDYTQNNAWGISTPEILKAEAEEHCSCDLTPLFEEWIYP